MNSFVISVRRLAAALVLFAALPVLAAGGVLVSAHQASAAVASSVEVKGNQRIEADTIKTYLVIKPGKAYGPADIDASIKALFDTGLFADVQIAQRGSVLVVTVVENPVINAVVFQGNKKIKTDILTQVVDSKPRDVLTDAKLQADVNQIKEYYSRSGRNNATVESKLTQLSDNRVNVTFIINEGDRTGVGSITFVGNKAFTASRLLGIIQTHTTNWLSWLTKNDVYSDEKVQADEEALRRFYLSHGYADFQVLSGDSSYDATRGRYSVTYTLDEGPRYTFGAVNIDSSIQGVNGASLMGFVKTRSGRVFNADDVQKSVEALTIELSRQGYVFAQVRPRGDRDYSSNTIAMTYVVDEGPRAYVERIDIRGNTKTRDYVIRREFEISEGDAYNRVLVDRAQRRLRDLGYFKSVQIDTEPGSAPDKVILVVNVEDQSTGSFSISAGLSTSDGFIAQVALEETNFLGRGQHVKISVGGGANSRDYNLSFTDPYFLGSHVSAGFDLYDTTTTSSSSAQPYNTMTVGGDVRLGLPLTDNLGLALNYSLVSNNINGTSSPFFPNGTRLTSSAGYGLTYSNLDNKMDPHEGIYVKVAQDVAGIGGDARWIRTTGDARVYAPVIPDSDIIGMLKLTGGNITGIGSPVVDSDNFFKGGETIRGFAPFGIGPRDGATGVALGGRNFVAGTAEVDFPLPLVPPDFGLRGAVFADAGTLWGNDGVGGTATYDDMAIRSSVGGSIIWASPFGQIRADFAQALTKQSYDQTQFFRLGAGTSF